jgi:hypothetical protein
VLNHWVTFWIPSRENQPPSDENFLLQEDGDRILQENGYGILLDEPALNTLVAEDGGQILQEDGGIIYTD